MTVLEKERYENNYSKVEHLEYAYLHGPGGILRKVSIDYVKSISTDIIETSSVTCFLDMDDVKNLEEVAFVRQLKLEELNGDYKRIRRKRFSIDYTSSIFRMIIYASIIVLHYNYGLI